MYFTSCRPLCRCSFLIVTETTNGETKFGHRDEKIRCPILDAPRSRELVEE